MEYSARHTSGLFNAGVQMAEKKKELGFLILNTQFSPLSPYFQKFDNTKSTEG